MARPWAEMRQLLEEERLCPALRGRVRYFATRYRHAHDSAGRVCILVDGVERLNMTQETEVWLSAQAGRRQGEFESLCECYAALAEETAQQGRFTPWDFGRAAEEYCISPIGASLSSPQPLVRLLAVLDRRVGKRRLRRLQESLAAQPAWLRYFYRLRLESESLLPPGEREDR